MPRKNHSPQVRATTAQYLREDERKRRRARMAARKLHRKQTNNRVETSR